MSISIQIQMLNVDEDLNTLNSIRSDLNLADAEKMPRHEYANLVERWSGKRSF